jgi:hypothetical protein
LPASIDDDDIVAAIRPAVPGYSYFRRQQHYFCFSLEGKSRRGQKYFPRDLHYAARIWYRQAVARMRLKQHGTLLATCKSSRRTYENPNDRTTDRRFGCKRLEQCFCAEDVIPELPSIVRLRE